MLAAFSSSKKSVFIDVMAPKTFNAWLKKQKTSVKTYLKTQGMKAVHGQYATLFNVKGEVATVICVVENDKDLWVFAKLARCLPKGVYRLKGLAGQALELATLAWGLECYRFDRYKKRAKPVAKLALDKAIDQEVLEAMLESVYWARDVINTPAEDMGPTELTAAVKDMLKPFKQAKLTVTKGKQLLDQNYPMIHAVGRASDDEPRLLDIRWGNAKHPKLTLVGKGVCYDTGALSMKTSKGMLTMKKDMGGAAHVLAMARMIMSQKLPVRLRVLIPAVENNVDGNAIRPGDVVRTRSGKAVEIVNTDAEGRLVLCDALTEAVSEKPELVMDYATLTGAARIALGVDIGALFSNDQAVAEAIVEQGRDCVDPVWQVPLYQPYGDTLKSDIADLVNCDIRSPFPAGHITAALYLEHFVEKCPWVHLDIMAGHLGDRPGRPKGGDVFSFRAVWAYLQERFSC